MATRVGIELSPTACRIVEVDGALPWRRSQGEIRVRSFSVLPPSGPETRTKLESLRRHPAAVIVWGGRSEHRQVMVTAGPYESMRAEAMASLSAAGLQTTGAWVDIALATSADDLASRRPVVVAMASASEMVEAVQPLRDAGIWVRTVTTPAVVLGSLARMRRAFSVPGAIESYVALDDQETCIALVRSGVLLAARDLQWGFTDADYNRSEPRSREDITTRLADAIREFVAAIGGSPADIGQVCVCGGLPELRSMAASLMDRLDVEVEPLDSLFGIDVSRLPEPADEFRERGAELRLAWAAAADWPPVINLLRARRRQVSKKWLARAAVVAGASAGLGGSWWVVERSRLWSTPTRGTRVASTESAPGRGPAAPAKPSAARVTPAAAPPAAVVTKTPVMTPPPAVMTKTQVVMPPPVVMTKMPVVPPPMVTRAPVVLPPPLVVTKPPVVMSPPAAVTTRPPVAPPPVTATTRPTVVSPPTAVVASAPVAPPRAVVEKLPVVVERARTEPPPVRARPAPPPEVAVPFDAVLGTILFSEDRKLAIIDNRIVAVGDEVRGARVIEITTGTVFLRDGQGRLRRLALGAGGR